MIPEGSPLELHLSKLCDGTHQHAKVQRTIAKDAGEYTMSLSRAVVAGAVHDAAYVSQWMWHYALGIKLSNVGQRLCRGTTRRRLQRRSHWYPNAFKYLQAGQTSLSYQIFLRSLFVDFYVFTITVGNLYLLQTNGMRRQINLDCSSRTNFRRRIAS